MEDPKLSPDDNNPVGSSPKINNKNMKEQKVEAFSDFLDQASNQISSEEKVIIKKEKQKSEKIDKSFFKRVLNEGFDGISSNPNYKMLALLIILLVNLSLFFVIGNIGKAFLRNAGIMAQ